MGKPKLNQKLNKGKHSLNPDRSKSSGGQNARDRTTVKRLLMYKGGKAQRDTRGKIIRPAPFQAKLTPGTVARIEPNRKWFGNTRVIGQSALQKFQEEMGKVMNDPYRLVMSKTKLPVSLLNEKAKQAQVHILETESFESTFGPKAHRKRPTINMADMSSLVDHVTKREDKYDEASDKNRVVEESDYRDEARHVVFRAGQSKRIWNELFKVIDSSDVIIQVLDVRDPMGTRSAHIEKYIRKEKSHKHLIFVLNKCDLVPTWVTQRWIATLSAEYPTLAFHASITNPFGKGALIQILRQFGKLHNDCKQISVGFIGYPNVGKSSIINTLRSKRVCNVSPIAGETKVWQYITLMRRIFLIDCPGVVYPTGDSETDLILKGVVRVEYIKNPEDHVQTVLDRAKKEYIVRTYGIDQWSSHEDFLEKLSFKAGKLLKGGQPDISTVAKMVLNDWQRGKIPFFVKPPESEKDPKLVSESITVVAQKPLPDVTKGSDLPSVDSAPVTNVESSVNEVKVKQKLTKLTVTPEFFEDDVKPLSVESDDEESCESSLSDLDDEEEIETQNTVVASSGSFMVAHAEKSSTKVSLGFKRPYDKSSDKPKTKRINSEIEDEQVDKKTRGKEKRQAYNKQKVRKIGTQFYSYANVKNRSQRK